MFNTSNCTVKDKVSYQKTRFTHLWFLILAIIMFSCSSYTSYTKRNDSNPISLSGEIINESYSSANGIFSINIPSPAERAYIEDYCNSEGDVGVRFCNNYGYFLEIQTMMMSQKILSLISKDLETKKEILYDAFNEITYPCLKDKVSNPKILNQKFVQLNDGELAFFAVVELPGYAAVGHFGIGSFSHQGILIFFKDKYFIEIATQDMYTLNSNPEYCLTPNLEENLLQSILRWTESLRLNCTEVSSI